MVEGMRSTTCCRPAAASAAASATCWVEYFLIVSLDLMRGVVVVATGTTERTILNQSSGCKTCLFATS